MTGIKLAIALLVSFTTSGSQPPPAWITTSTGRRKGTRSLRTRLRARDAAAHRRPARAEPRAQQASRVARGMGRRTRSLRRRPDEGRRELRRLHRLPLADGRQRLRERLLLG